MGYIIQVEKKYINCHEIIEKFHAHKGKIVNFCRNYNIRPQQLYKQRKKLKKISTQTFHTVDMSKTIDKPHSYSKEIKIEIENAEMYIPKGDKPTLQYILKELSTIC